MNYIKQRSKAVHQHINKSAYYVGVRSTEGRKMCTIAQLPMGRGRKYHHLLPTQIWWSKHINSVGILTYASLLL